VTFFYQSLALACSVLVGVLSLSSVSPDLHSDVFHQGGTCTHHGDNGSCDADKKQEETAMRIHPSVRWFFWEKQLKSSGTFKHAVSSEFASPLLFQSQSLALLNSPSYLDLLTTFNLSQSKQTNEI
jgi:hypothetical protein